MKIAVVFDDLIQFGGAERLLLAIHELYPNAPVFTSLASRTWLTRCKDKRIRLVTSFMQKLPIKRSLNRFYGLLGLHVLAFESFKFAGYDIVLSISARFAHAVVTKPGTTHVCYMNSPGRMFWEPGDYFNQEGVLQNDWARRLFWFMASPLLSLLRLWDYACAQRVDYFIANSKVSQDRIKKYYRRDSTIIYPFVDDFRIAGQVLPSSLSTRPALGESAGPLVTGAPAPYYLVITRLNAWKRVDIAIEACRMTQNRLKVIGEGPDRTKLENLTHGQENIEFLGYVDEQAKIAAIQNCAALIITQKEDFGVTALEAASLGKPVLAYRAGGVLETVLEGMTGAFFNEQTPQSLAQALTDFNPSNYDSQNCIAQSKNFSKQKFLRELDDFIKTVYDSKNILH